MITGQRSLAEIEAKLDLSDVRYCAAYFSHVISIANTTPHLRVLGSNSMAAVCLLTRTKRRQPGRIEGKPRGESGMKYKASVGSHT
jgi:hypothetical protein